MNLVALRQVSTAWAARHSRLPCDTVTTIRYGLPAVLVLAGFAILLTAGDSVRWEGWAMCVGAGLSVLLLNVLFRYGRQGDRERDAEESAREHFGRHGRWPDEPS